MTETNEKKHSPTPWSCSETPWHDYIVRDRDGRRLAVCHVLEGEPNEREATDKANMKFIVDCVNYRHSQAEMAERLFGQREEFRKKMLETTKERETLKDLLRRAVPCIESCIGHLRNDRATSLGDPKTMMVYTRTIEDVAVLLDKVRKAIGEEVGNG